jgi:hypothetical protein
MRQKGATLNCFEIETIDERSRFMSIQALKENVIDKSKDVC